MKKLIRYVPAHFLACIIVGICLQFYLRVWQFGFQKLICILILLFSILLLFLFLKKKIIYSVLSWFLFILIGISSVYSNHCKNYANYYGKIKKEHSSSILKVDKVLKPNTYYTKYEASVIQIDSISTRGKILLSISKDSSNQSLKEGQKLLIKSPFKEITPSLNPYTFNYKNYLLKKGIEEQVFLTSDSYFLIENTTFSFKKLVVDFRMRIQQLLRERHFNKEELDIINALLLGQRQGISKELINDYTRAGAIHILAISGLHIGIILVILSMVFHPLEKLKNGNFIKAFLIVIILWLFAIFTGLSASVVRATAMFTFIALGNIFQKKKNTEHSLITSMFVLLLIKPMFLFDLGFQLSYIAVFSIIWIQPLLYRIWTPRYKFIDKTWQLITVSVAAQIGILPISLYYFHQFPGLFLLSNLIIIPLLGIILFGGFIIIILALFHFLPDFLVTMYSYIIELINAFVYWISLQEAFLFSNISMSFLKMLSLYTFIIFCYQFIIKKKVKQLIFFLFSIILIQSIFLFEKQNLLTTREFIIFHKNKNSIIGIKKGEVFTTFHNLDSISLKKDKTIPSYLVGKHITKTNDHKNRHVYKFNKRNILCIDSLGVYSIKGLQNPIILLQNSPKVNLERLIKQLQPQQIISDGSNYKSYAKKWQKTCIKQKTPFYDTRKNGAYIIK